MEHTIKDGLVAGFGPGEIVYDADKDADNTLVNLGRHKVNKVVHASSELHLLREVKRYLASRNVSIEWNDEIGTVFAGWREVGSILKGDISRDPN